MYSRPQLICGCLPLCRLPPGDRVLRLGQANLVRALHQDGAAWLVGGPVDRDGQLIREGQPRRADGFKRAGARGFRRAGRTGRVSLGSLGFLGSLGPCHRGGRRGGDGEGAGCGDEEGLRATELNFSVP